MASAFLGIASAFAIAANAAEADKPTLADVLEQEEQGVVEVKDGAEPDVSAAARGPRDLLERDTPRSAVRAYIAAARKGDYEKAAQYLDLRNLPRGLDAGRGPQYARQLKIVLDWELWIDSERLSTDAKVHRDDRLPTYRDWVGIVDLDGKPVDILLQRVPVEGGKYV